MTGRVVAVIAGSGFDGPFIEGSETIERTMTPYGLPSSAITAGAVRGTRVLFILRHGERHSYPPHAVPYAANIFALKRAGTTEIVAIATVGGVADNMPPGALAVPDDLVDMTRGRVGSIYRDERDGVKHVDFTHPFDAAMRDGLIRAAGRAGIDAVPGGVYWCSEGPRLETAAEVRVVRMLGGAMVGMTACPEAAIAREMGLPYALLSPSVNWAAGLGDSRDGIDLEALTAASRLAVARARTVALEYCASP